MAQGDWILIAGALLSEFVGTLSGFGSSTFFVPLALFFESFHLVLALTALLHCFGNLSKLVLFRKHANMRLLLKWALPSILLTGVGAYLVKDFEIYLIKKILGAFLVLVALWTLLANEKRLRLSEKSAGLMMGISGFTTGLIGTGGALRGLVLSALNLDKMTFVFISSGIDFGGDLLRATIYLSKGFLDREHLFYLPLLGLAAWVGALVGRLVLKRISQSAFEKIVALFLLISGLGLIFK